MKWENLVSVYRCRQSSRVVTSGQAKQKQNCRQFSTEINRVQLLWYPLCPSPFYPNLASHCRSQQVCLIFFPKLLQVPFAMAVRKWQLVQGEHPGECWWQNGICWSYNLSREKCVLIPHEVLWQVRNYAKKCDLGSPSLQTLILGTKEQIV